jgi:hypothetical protein
MKGWNLMCNVNKIVFDVENKCGYLYTPEFNYPDMTRTVKAFTSVDPEIKVIFTISGEKPDTTYTKTIEGWVAT